MTALAGMIGHAPGVLISTPPNPDRVRHVRMWATPTAREKCTGEQWAVTFLSQAVLSEDAEVIDFGCGTGRGALMLALLGGMKVTMVDFAPNCLDEEVRDACRTQAGRIRFREHDLLLDMPVSAPYGFAAGVIECIPPQHVRNVLRNMLGAAQHLFFVIATEPDPLGARLTVQPYQWWLDKLREAGAVIHWSEQRATECAIYCSIWRPAAEVIAGGRVNVDWEVLDRNVRANIDAGWQHAAPWDKQDREVILLAGGPSLAMYEPQIRAMREEGKALVTVNGSYHWAMERGLQPSVQIVIDARPFNARFTRPVCEGTKYLIASQCDPSTLEGLPFDRTFLWHPGVNDEQARYAHAKVGFYYYAPGGSTVILRALPLLRMLGLWNFHVFGFDSCVIDNAHHAYAQPENDDEVAVPVSCGGKIFRCTAWQISQAQEFQDFVRMMGEEINLAVYGPGLIAHMLETSAALDLAAST